jgi:hypothetical protein
MSPTIISNDVLTEARVFFEECGEKGCEGTAMIAMSTSTGETRLVIPEQRAGASPFCWVEVTEVGKLALAVALGGDERYVSRIHSHPQNAFHSPTDDANPAITHEGALSIVVPHFGRGLADGLDGCAVLRLIGGRWIDLPPGAARDQYVVAP